MTGMSDEDRLKVWLLIVATMIASAIVLIVEVWG